MTSLNRAPVDPAAEDFAFLEAVSAGIASLDEGRFLPYEAVREWLLTWGSAEELPPPECP